MNDHEPVATSPLDWRGFGVPERGTAERAALDRAAAKLLAPPGTAMRLWQDTAARLRKLGYSTGESAALARLVVRDDRVGYRKLMRDLRRSVRARVRVVRRSASCSRSPHRAGCSTRRTGLRSSLRCRDPGDGDDGPPRRRDEPASCFIDCGRPLGSRTFHRRSPRLPLAFLYFQESA